MRSLPLQQPSLTLMARLLVSGMDATARWSRPFALAVACGALGLATAVDASFGGRWSVGFLYMLACIVAVWCVGERAGFGLAVADACLAAWLRHGHLPIGYLPANEVWDLVARTLSAALLATVVHGFGCVLTLERWRAARDELTGVLNRSGFGKAMVAKSLWTRERGDNLLLAYLDLDGFKEVNDQHGHAAGDHLLRGFAAAASAALRPTDLFARIGGDEFAMLLTLPPSVDGHRVANLLHHRFTGILGRSGFEVTCSMGAVFLGSEDAAVDQATLEQADALMYEAKQTGKNALRVARGHALNKVLRTAFPPFEDDELDELLRRIDAAERRNRRPLRRVA